MRTFVIGVAAAAALFITAASASADVFTIRGDWKIGTFAVKRDGTLRGAIDAFGTPGDKDRNGLACVVRWPRHGLEIHFYNLGGHNPCRPRFGLFSHARAQGLHWRTDRGLEIGDRQRRLRNLYPNARFHPAEPGFWPAGLVGRASMVAARFQLLPGLAREDGRPARDPIPRSLSRRRRLASARRTRN